MTPVQAPVPLCSALIPAHKSSGRCVALVRVASRQVLERIVLMPTMIIFLLHPLPPSLASLQAPHLHLTGYSTLLLDVLAPALAPPPTFLRYFGRALPHGRVLLHTYVRQSNTRRAAPIYFPPTARAAGAMRHPPLPGLGAGVACTAQHKGGGTEGAAVGIVHSPCPGAQQTRAHTLSSSDAIPPPTLYSVMHKQSMHVCIVTGQNTVSRHAGGR